MPTLTPEAEMLRRCGASGPDADPRQRLLHEACVRFYRDGIRAVGIDLLIAEADVAKATFYRHFPSKRDLVLAYMECRYDAWMGWLADRIEHHTRTRPRTPPLLAVFDVLEELFRDPGFRGSAILNAVAEYGDDDPALIEQARALKARLHAYLAGLAGEMPTRRRREVADVWLLLIDGAVVTAQRERSTAPAKFARRAAARYLAATS